MAITIKHDTIRPVTIRYLTLDVDGEAVLVKGFMEEGKMVDEEFYYDDDWQPIEDKTLLDKVREFLQTNDA